MRKNKAAEIALNSVKAAYDAYCSVLEDELNALYDEVQEDFSKFYRAINEDDEGKFTAKLTPTEGKLDFNVNFYERGLFPPGAYHSEGHQDGMGVCLYLALMKRLFGDQFTFALSRTVFYNSGHTPLATGCRLQRFETAARMNWHYECANALVDGTLEISKFN
jgi:hypothetical protein